MGECEGTDGRIVCLEDGLKVEGESVPESEFTACGAGEYSSTLGRPLKMNRD